jgi:hypothetical protein
MSHTLTLACGCIVYVSCHPKTNVAHSRIIERRGARCENRKHAIGVRLWLWEMLPESDTGGGTLLLEESSEPARRTVWRSAAARFAESSFDE